MPARPDGLECLAHSAELVNVVKQGRDTDNFPGRPDGLVAFPTVFADELGSVDQICAPVLAGGITGSGK